MREKAWIPLSMLCLALITCLFTITESRADTFKKLTGPTTLPVVRSRLNVCFDHAVCTDSKEEVIYGFLTDKGKTALGVYGENLNVDFAPGGFIEFDSSGGGTPLPGVRFGMIDGDHVFNVHSYNPAKKAFEYVAVKFRAHTYVFFDVSGDGKTVARHGTLAESAMLSDENQKSVTFPAGTEVTEMVSRGGESGCFVKGSKASGADYFYDHLNKIRAFLNSSTSSWGGHWNLASQFEAGPLELVQTGNSVSGKYKNGKGYGHIQGTVAGKTLEGRWTDPISNNSGTFKWTMAQDGRTFKGFFTWQGKNYDWNGNR